MVAYTRTTYVSELKDRNKKQKAQFEQKMTKVTKKGLNNYAKYE